MASEKIINQKKEEVANLAAKMKEAKITKADYIAYVLQIVFLAIIIVTKFI